MDNSKSQFRRAMTSLLIENCRLYDTVETGPLTSIAIRDGVIAEVGADVASDKVLDAQGLILAPGFIDVHIQGAGGADVLDATPEALETISRTCARFGVTGFLATTVYKPGQENRHLQVAADCAGEDLGGARLLGIHLEGPFIAPQKRGMIQPDCLAEPSSSVLEHIYRLTGDSLKMMTLAPELPGSLDLIGPLQDRGTIAALGHTHATYEEAVRGLEAGIRHVTHLFNAMPAMHHRAPGPLAAIFERTDVTAQVITDGVHAHPAIVRLAFGALGATRFIPITDGMQAMGLPDGRYAYNGIEYEARDGAARYADGTLIGTALGLNRMLARFMQFTGCSLTATIDTVTQNTDRLLRLDGRKGTVRAGSDADLVLLDRNLEVYATIVGGRAVYER
ncbi:MAG: N-acetylglucosamine-6-phosphate deacetylase [Sedimentisphaerales bacterium]|nr:N-acetylglucosamine-6-phosphate deacetylase [Sedimentisphaerales bacterium]